MFLRNHDNLNKLFDVLGIIHGIRLYLKPNLDSSPFPGIYKAEQIALNYTQDKTTCSLYVHEPENLPPSDSVLQRQKVISFMKEFFSSGFVPEVFFPPETNLRIDPSFELNIMNDDKIRLELFARHDEGNMQKEYIKKTLNFCKISKENQLFLSEILLSLKRKTYRISDKFPVFHSALELSSKYKTINKTKVYLFPFPENDVSVTRGHLQTLDIMIRDSGYLCNKDVIKAMDQLCAFNNSISLNFIGIDMHEDQHDIKIYFSLFDSCPDGLKILHALLPDKDKQFLETQELLKTEGFSLKYIGIGHRKDKPVIKTYYFRNAID